MTKEEVLQRANDYCNERSYDESTLTSEFKDKFADFFAKKYGDASLDDDTVIADLKFNLDTAKSASAQGRTSLQRSFDTKEAEYKNQIDELTKKIDKKNPPPPATLPEEVQAQIKELMAYKDEKAKAAKFDSVMKLAKKSVRQDLHASFEKFANGIEVDVNKEDGEQADALVSRFQEIFKDTIGDIKPLSPRQTQKRDDDVMSSLQTLKV